MLITVETRPYREVFHPTQAYIFKAKCPMCDAEHDALCPAEGLFAYRRGALVQNAFPTLNAAQREALMTGLCTPCFNLATPEEDDE